MSFPVDYTTTIDGVTIKCSKTFDQLGTITADDLREYAIAGIYDIAVGRAGLSCESLSGAAKVKANTPVEYTGVAWDDVRVNFNDGSYNPPVNAPHYGFSILVYGTEGQNIRSTSDNARLVLDVPIQDIYCDMPALTSSTITAQNDGDMSDENSITIYDTNSSGVIKTVANDSNTQLHVMAVFIYDDNKFFIVPSSFMGGYSFIHTTYIWGGNYSGAGGSLSGTYWIQPYYAEQYDSQTGIYANMANDMILAGKIISSLDWTKSIVAIFDTGEQEKEQTDSFVVLQYTGMYGSPSFTGYITFYPKTERQSYLGFANSSLKFKYNNTMYKPVIEQGVVIDYTDNMDDPSEFDDITTVTGNDVPVTPPTPPVPPGPYEDDPWNGATFAGTGVGGAGAFAKCYYMTSTELANLRTWMNSISVPEGFDPMQQIIGLSQVPVALSGSSPENVVFVNSSAVYDPGVTTRAVDTGVATQQAMGTPISYYLGSVDIVRRMQQRGEPYLDYDCQIELYLPLIGMFSLDTQAVMGRTIYAYAVLDPVSGTLAAYAYVTKDGQNLPIAYGSTTIGVDLPISAQQLSVSRAALKQANAQLGTSLLSSTLSFIAAATAGGKGSGTGAKTATGANNGLAAAGIREAGADYMKASQVGNVFGDFMNWGRTIRQLSYGNNTAISGSFGGSTAQWSYPFTPYVKIIRPRYEKPSNYAHSQGVPCVQTKTIGSCTGFIQCIGADVSGITGATDLELQAIQAALSNGIFAGGGQ